MRTLLINFEKSSIFVKFWKILHILPKFENFSILSNITKLLSFVEFWKIKLSKIWKIIIFCQNLKNLHILPKFEKSSILWSKICKYAKSWKKVFIWGKKESPRKKHLGKKKFSKIRQVRTSQEYPNLNTITLFQQKVPFRGLFTPSSLKIWAKIFLSVL